MISYITEDIRFPFNKKRITSRWLKEVAEREGKKIGDISVVFCSDEYLLSVNKQYLNHNYYTDIITFDYCEGNTLSGDLLISIDSVRDNANYYEVSFEEELNRVIVHGVLHLMGYDDHTPEDIAQMRAKENSSLYLLSQL